MGKSINETRIGVIGLGYVGLPLAVEFAKKFPTVGFDINEARVAELNTGIDSTLEVDSENLKSVLVDSLPETGNGLLNSSSLEDLKSCNFYIITVPTPTDKHNRPVLTPLIKASETIAKVIDKGDVVVYESTVYPGVTEDECIPIIEKNTGLIFNRDFYAGYSPERINPGDKEHTVTKIKKVTSGSTEEMAEYIDKVYQEVIVAGTFKASSIKVAEAAKVIENSQRDINIAFVNELSKIFNLLQIDTHEVLEAASTKWNFLQFKPGLVGGHCIGVDPYYLAQKAQEVGYHPEIILAGRRLNDGMGPYVATEAVKWMLKKGHKVAGAKALMLGITFKENCPDIRNSRAIDVYHELKTYDMDVDVYDPWADNEEVKGEYGIDLINSIDATDYSLIVLAVAHKEFGEISLEKHVIADGVIYDVKAFLPKSSVTARL
ncbi:nucleotide sugar dehydrogenase [Phaeocystidibacter luteus]|uniref:Nucleotide sugar dehydrogenase n=1 Tax=Phaeocystidibacter luteus TaxID=911197 RepID=A0A6N6RK64_9FLAO|nr:nucleotide sugar dehydrogenase [Phaeocystidibacter luteus]KAB2814315.1 nucleotide sugar dehydrogenase [Phaeocystidibacter luteus]